MTKYVETINAQPTTTKTTFVTGGTFSWAPQNDRLAEAGIVEVPAQAKPSGLNEKRESQAKQLRR
jgi:hypothetical protein